MLQDVRGPIKRCQLVDTLGFVIREGKLQFSAFRACNSVHGQLFVEQGKSISVRGKNEALQRAHSRTQAGMEDAQGISGGAGRKARRLLDERYGNAAGRQGGSHAATREA